MNPVARQVINQLWEQAAQQGEILFVVYARGEQPGAMRALGPIKLLSPELGRAWCLASGRVKCYRFEELVVVDQGATFPRYRDPDGVFDWAAVP